MGSCQSAAFLNGVFEFNKKAPLSSKFKNESNDHHNAFHANFSEKQTQQKTRPQPNERCTATDKARYELASEYVELILSRTRRQLLLQANLLEAVGSSDWSCRLCTARDFADGAFYFNRNRSSQMGVGIGMTWRWETVTDLLLVLAAEIAPINWGPRTRHCLRDSRTDMSLEVVWRPI